MSITGNGGEILHELLTPLQIASNPLEVDPNDSVYGTGTETRASTIASNIYDFTYENGRRYHGYREGKYVLPNDADEQERLDIVHHMMLILLEGRLHLAPLDQKPQRILDLGCGTGIWAIDMATQYPSAEVVGTDLSPIQPKWIPPNCRFEIGDVESSWSFAKESFDLVHMRHIGYSLRDWDRVIAQTYEHLKPGGWIELCEHDTELRSDDNTYPESCAVRTILEKQRQAFLSINMDPEYLHKLEKRVRDSGFVDVRIYRMKLPWGGWAKDKTMKEVGRWCFLQIEAKGFEAYNMALMTRYLNMPAEEVLKLCADAREEIRSKKFHVYLPMYTVYGRKPE